MVCNKPINQFKRGLYEEICCCGVGHYASGSGSSHKGGNYVNRNTGNRYGKHK